MNNPRFSRRATLARWSAPAAAITGLALLLGVNASVGAQEGDRPRGPDAAARQPGPPDGPAAPGDTRVPPPRANGEARGPARAAKADGRRPGAGPRGQAGPRGDARQPGPAPDQQAGPPADGPQRGPGPDRQAGPPRQGPGPMAGGPQRGPGPDRQAGPPGPPCGQPGLKDRKGPPAERQARAPQAPGPYREGAPGDWARRPHPPASAALEARLDRLEAKLDVLLRHIRRLEARLAQGMEPRGAKKGPREGADRRPQGGPVGMGAPMMPPRGPQAFDRGHMGPGAPGRQGPGAGPQGAPGHRGFDGPGRQGPGAGPDFGPERGPMGPPPYEPGRGFGPPPPRE